MLYDGCEQLLAVHVRDGLFVVPHQDLGQLFVLLAVWTIRSEQAGPQQAKQGPKTVLLASMRRTREEDARFGFIVFKELLQQLIPECLSSLLVAVQVMGFVNDDQVPALSGQQAVVATIVVVAKRVERGRYL